MGILGGLKALGGGLTGKTVTPQFGHQVDISTIVKAKNEAIECISSLMKDHKDEEFQVNVEFSNPDTLNGKRVILDIEFNDWNPDIAYTLKLPMSKKEMGMMLKSYKKKVNVSVDPFLFANLNDVTECYFGSSQLETLCDFLSHIDLDPNKEWIKGGVKASFQESIEF